MFTVPYTVLPSRPAMRCCRRFLRVSVRLPTHGAGFRPRCSSPPFHVTSLLAERDPDRFPGAFRGAQRLYRAPRRSPRAPCERYTLATKVPKLARTPEGFELCTRSPRLMARKRSIKVPDETAPCSPTLHQGGFTEPTPSPGISSCCLKRFASPASSSHSRRGGTTPIG